MLPKSNDILSPFIDPAHSSSSNIPSCPISSALQHYGAHHDTDLCLTQSSPPLTPTSIVTPPFPRTNEFSSRTSSRHSGCQCHPRYRATSPFQQETIRPQERRIDSRIRTTALGPRVRARDAGPQRKSSILQTGRLQRTAYVPKGSRLRGRLTRALRSRLTTAATNVSLTQLIMSRLWSHQYHSDSISVFSTHRSGSEHERRR